MAFVAGLLVGGVVVFLVCAAIAAHYLDGFIRNFWNG